MSATELDALLGRMPQIAEAVERFTSESVQADVFQALIRAFGAPTGTPVSVKARAAKAGVPVGQSDSEPGATALIKKPVTKRAPGSKVKQSFTVDKTLDLVNGGTPPFREFWEAKKPGSVTEKCLVSVYWLSRLTREPIPVTVEQVYTCFKAANWAVPSDLVNTLQQAGTKGWLDTKKRDDLKVVVPGENHIEHEMPAKPRAA